MFCKQRMLYGSFRLPGGKKDYSIMMLICGGKIHLEVVGLSRRYIMRTKLFSVICTINVKIHSYINI